MIEEFSDDALFPSCVTSAKPNGYGAKPVYSSIPLVFIFHCLKTFDTFVQRFVTDAFRVPDGLPVVFLTSDFHIRLVCICYSSSNGTFSFPQAFLKESRYSPYSVCALPMLEAILSIVLSSVE